MPARERLGGEGWAPRIPSFPDFAPPTLEFAEEFRALARVPEAPLSEFTFANLFVFRTAHDYRMSRLGDHILVIGTGYDGVRYAFPPLGSSDPRLALEFLCRHLAGDGTDPLVFPVPAPWFGTRLREDDWFGEADRDQADYVYRRADLAELPGRRYHRKRNRIQKFLREAGKDLHYEDLTDAHVPQCLELADAWCGIRCSAARPTSYAETAAVREALVHHRALGLEGGLLRSASRVRAFCLGEPLDATTFVVHFEKADPQEDGLAQLLNREFSRRALGGFAYVNREQDLGEPGLRQAKMSYHPVHLVEKYRVWPRRRSVGAIPV